MAITWLGLAVAEGVYHRALQRGLAQLDNDFHQRRIERAQRRYLAAIETLALVRRLEVPKVQLNIGEKQINFSR